MNHDEIERILTKDLDARSREISLMDGVKTTQNPNGDSRTKGRVVVGGIIVGYLISKTQVRVHRPRPWHDCYYCNLVGDGNHYEKPKISVSYEFSPNNKEDGC